MPDSTSRSRDPLTLPRRLLLLEPAPTPRTEIATALAGAFEVLELEDGAALGLALPQGPWEAVVLGPGCVDQDWPALTEPLRGILPVVLLQGERPWPDLAPHQAAGVLPLAPPSAAGELAGRLDRHLEGLASPERERLLGMFRATLEATADGLLVVDDQRRVVWANAKFYDMWRIPEELRQDGEDERLLACVLEQLEDPEAFLRTVNELYADDTSVTVHQIRFKDGRVFERNSQPQRFGGTGPGRVWSFRDITSRIQAEHALKESEARYRTLVEAAPDAIFIDQGGRFAYLNKACLGVFGVPSKEGLLGREVLTFIHAEDRALVQARLEQPVPEALECRLAAADGVLRWAEVATTPVRFLGGEAIQVLVRDITARKLAAQALKESEENYRELVESAPDPVFVELEGRFAYLNPAALLLLAARAPEELLGRSVLDIVPPAFQDLVAHRLEQFAQDPVPLSRVEIHVEALDGRMVEVEVTTTPMFFQGRPAARVFLRDVTERRAAQRALMKEMKFSDEAINSLPGVFYAYDANGRFLRWNRNFEQVSGYTAEEISKMSPLGFFEPEWHQPITEAIEKVFQEGENRIEAPFKTKDGRGIEYLFTGRRMETEGGPLLVGMGVDISVRKAAEQAMAESEDRYRTLVEQAPDCIFVAQGGRFRFVNAAGQRLFEAESERELLDQSLMDRIHPEDRDRMAARSEQLYRTGQPKPPEELRIVGLKGREVVAEFTTTAIQYQGHPAARVFLKDVTSRRLAEEALRESEATLRAFFDGAPFQMGVTELAEDGDVILVSVNEPVARLLGRSPEACRGLRISSLGIGDGTQGIWEVQYGEAWKARGTVQFEYESTIPGQPPCWFSVALSFIGETPAGRPRFSYVMEDITGRRRAEERFRRLIENSADGLILGDPEGRVFYASPAAATILGYSVGELTGLKNLYALVHIDDQGAIRVLLRGPVRQEPGVPHGIEVRMQRKDDAWRWLELVYTNRLEDPSVAAVVLNFRDITDRKMQELLERDRRSVLELVAANTPLAETLAHIALMLEHQRPGMKAGLMLVEEGHLRVGAGASLPETFLQALEGVPVSPGRGSCAEAAYRAEPVLAGNTATHSSWASHRELARIHHLRACWSYPVISASGHVLGTLSLYDTSPRLTEEVDLELMAMASRLAAVAIEQHQLTDQLAHQAQHDALTGLPNRMLFEDRLHQALARAKRLKHFVGVLYLDLDRFKHINDTLGHSAGDILLKEAASRLTARTRQTDTLARMGGDEFTIVLTELKDPQDAAKVAQKILEAIRDPFLVEGHELFVTASIGISLFPEDGPDSATLQRSADTAMYRAKEKGKDNFQWFAAEMDLLAHERLEMEGYLRRALEHRELFLLYQPQFRAADGALLGFEALMRWRHPSLGLVSPARFIPLAEESGLIVPMGAWALREAAGRLAAWHAAGHEDLRVAVNVSAVQFKRPDWVDTVRAVIEETGIPPKSLELEITESLLLQSATETTAHVFQLRDLGVAMAIDDFGTGYSSLSYLHRLPVTTLKIDQSFVRAIGTEIRADREDAPIVRTIITLAHSLGMEVMAEGVETEGQLAFLRNLGCEGIQGFLLGKPMPQEEAEALMGQRKAAAKPKASPKAKPEPAKPKAAPKRAKPAPKKTKASAKKAGARKAAPKKVAKKASKKAPKR